MSEASRSHGDFGFMSFNVLLPHSADGWWIYKYYQPHLPKKYAEWTYRQSLLKRDLLQAQTDLICIQEAEATHFEQDFEFSDGSN